VLALCGAIGSIALLIIKPEATNGLLVTAIVLAVVAVLLLWLAPQSVHRAIAGAEPQARLGLGSGEPRAAWKLPLGFGALALVVGVLAGWDAGLRVSLTAFLAGLTLAFLLERIVALNERVTGRKYYRIEGSRLRRSRLAYLRG
jgi:hypothetical protein